MTKVKLFQAKFESIEREIYSECQNCSDPVLGQEVEEVNALEEASIEGRFDSDGNFSAGGYMDSSQATYYPTDYRCARCGYSLVRHD